MIDKSIEYKNIIMVMDGKAALAISEPCLPAGFAFRFFAGEEDIAHWCRIEASVGEFDSEEQARAHFGKEFGAHLAELKERCVFVVNESGLPVATAMGWFGDGKGEPVERACARGSYETSFVQRTNRLHWISASPYYQGLGLGKAVSQKAVVICAALSPGEDVWLSTQTWSHRAVVMYNKLGFVMAKSPLEMVEKNSYVEDYDRAIQVLSGVLPREQVEKLVETAL